MPVVAQPEPIVATADHPSAGGDGRYRMLRAALQVIRLGPVLILAGLIIAMWRLSPVFLTTGNAGNVLSQSAAIAVLAVGQLLVILTRGIDLSVGAVAALSSVVGAKLMTEWLPGATSGESLSYGTLGAAIAADCDSTLPALPVVRNTGERRHIATTSPSRMSTGPRRITCSAARSSR